MSQLLDIIELIGDISLWVLNETGKGLESNNFRVWSPICEPTVIERNGSHKGLNIIGATEIKDHFDFLYHEYSKGQCAITAFHIVMFLKDLLQYDKAKGINITMIQLDNAMIHKSEVLEFAKNHKDNLVLIYQPPYSPRLNPQEYIWNRMKDFISKASAAKNEQELSDNIKRFKSYIKSHPNEVRQWVYTRNYFKSLFDKHVNLAVKRTNVFQIEYYF